MESEEQDVGKSIVCGKWVLAIVLSAALVAGCSDLAMHIRQHTYPPDFKYIDQTQVQSAVWQLAADVTALDRVMRQSAPSDVARRGEVRRLLGAMDDATSALRTGGRPTNHPLIADHIEQFRRDLALARAGVDLEPPNYYLVGSVAGACLTCHAGER